MYAEPSSNAIEALSRQTHITTITWPTGGVTATIYPWSYLTSDAKLSAYMKTVAYYSMDAVLRFVVSGDPTTYGRLIAYIKTTYAPIDFSLHSLAKYAVPHILMDPSQNAVYELVVPMYSHHGTKCHNLTQAAAIGGPVDTTTFVAVTDALTLRSSSAAVPNDVRVAVYVYYRNVKLFGATATVSSEGFDSSVTTNGLGPNGEAQPPVETRFEKIQPPPVKSNTVYAGFADAGARSFGRGASISPNNYALTYQDAQVIGAASKYRKSQFVGFKKMSSEVSGTGPVSTIASGVGRLADTVGNAVPALKPFTTPVKIISTIGAGIAKLFGFSRPVDPDPHVLSYDNNQTASNSRTGAALLGSDPSQQLVVDAVAFNDTTSSDELALTKFCSRFGTIATASVVSTTSPGDVVLVLPVTPCIAVGSGAVWKQAILAPPVSHAAVAYSQWCGSLKYKVTAVSNSFIRGSISIRRALIPEDFTDISVVTTNFNSTDHAVILDLSNSSSVEFEVPYAAPTPMLPVSIWPTAMYKPSLVGEFSPDCLRLLEALSGVLYFEVLTPIHAPYEPATVTLIVEIAGGGDLKFAGPTLGNITNACITFDTVSSAPIVLGDAPRGEPIAVTSGVREVTIRSLLKQLLPVARVTYILPANTNTVNLQLLLRPPMDPSGWELGDLKGAYGSSNKMFASYRWWFSRCFLFERGGSVFGIDYIGRGTNATGYSPAMATDFHLVRLCNNWYRDTTSAGAPNYRTFCAILDVQPTLAATVAINGAISDGVTWTSGFSPSTDGLTMSAASSYYSTMSSRVARPIATVVDVSPNLKTPVHVSYVARDLPLTGANQALILQTNTFCPGAATTYNYEGTLFYGCADDYSVHDYYCPPLWWLLDNAETRQMWTGV